MAEEWLSYAELGERLGISAEAARCRASRLRLRRQMGNDGKARVAVDPDELARNPPRPPDDRPVTDRAPAQLPASDQAVTGPVENEAGQLAEALRDQVAFLKDQLVKAEAAAERERDRVSELVADLRKLAERMAEAEKANAEVERARAEAEQAKANLAAFRARPWWRRAFG